jgi:hypothetical protein
MHAQQILPYVLGTDGNAGAPVFSLARRYAPGGAELAILCCTWSTPANLVRAIPPPLPKPSGLVNELTEVGKHDQKRVSRDIMHW